VVLPERGPTMSAQKAKAPPRGRRHDHASLVEAVTSGQTIAERDM
jgi:hypothetical protein